MPCNMKKFVKLNRKWCRASHYILALLIAPLLCLIVVPSANAADATADKLAADAKVKAATTPIEKINAFYSRALLPGANVLKIVNPLDHKEEWERAESDINEAVRLIAEVEADGKSKITGKHAIYFEQGFILMLLEKYQEAVAAYDLAEKAGYIQANTNDKLKVSGFFGRRGSAKAGLYDYDGAIADYKAALALLNRAQTRRHLAQAHFEKGDLTAADEEWDRALELDKDIGDSPFLAAQARLNKAVFDNPNKAAPLIERARYTFKKIHEATLVADILSEAAGGNEASKRADLLNPALKDLDRAIKSEPQSAAPWIERGRMRLVYMSLRPEMFKRSFDYEDTQKDFNRAVALDPKNAGAWFDSGRTRLTRLEQLENATFASLVLVEEQIKRREAATSGAIRDFSRAIYLQPDASGEAHFQRAQLERRKPQPDANTLLTDYSAAIAQNLQPTDAAWHALLRNNSNLIDPAALTEAHLMRGRILMSRGQLVAALADFDAVIAASEGNLSARFERGKVRVHRGDYDGAIEDFSRLIKGNGKVADAWMWRGVARDGKGETEAAKADLKEAVARDAKVAGLMRGTRYDAQNPDANRGLAPTPQKEDLKNLPPGTALDHKNAGNALRAKGDEDGALAEYNLALMIDPNFADALNNRGSTYKTRGQVDLAVADFSRAIESEPKHRVAYLNRGFLWRELGEAERERADFDRAIEFADSDERRAAAYSARAVTRQTAKDTDGALQDAKRSTELAPKHAEAWSEQGHVLLNARRPAEAAVSYRRALELTPENVDTRVFLAIALAIQNDATATTELDSALAKAKPPELDEARATLDRALRINPDSAALKALKERAAKVAPAK